MIITCTFKAFHTPLNSLETDRQTDSLTNIVKNGAAIAPKLFLKAYKPWQTLKNVEKPEDTRKKLKENKMCEKNHKIVT